VRAVWPEHFVVRTGYVFGGGTDWVTTQLRAMAGGSEGAGLSDRSGTPTYVRHLAERLLPLALTGRFGTYHLGGPEPLSYYELLGRARDLGGLAGEVREQTSEELGLRAVRPRNSALTSLFLPELGIAPMPPLDEALSDLLGRL
jgi:dTDP-4-dehydrorhamnose reductase